MGDAGNTREQGGPPEAFDAFAAFVLWTETKLTDLDFCKSVWPDLAARPDRPWDAPHYIHHRYTTSFPGCFLSFLRSTPTYRESILTGLCKEYGEPVDRECWRTMSHVCDDGDKFLAENSAVRAYLASPPRRRKELYEEALERRAREEAAFPPNPTLERFLFGPAPAVRD